MSVLVENPGLSIVAFDPGGTTGVAVYDACTGRVFCDQIDAGLGVISKGKVHSGFTESREREETVRVLYGRGWWDKRGHGAAGEAAVVAETEDRATQVMVDVCTATGPNTVIIMEDFILGWGDAGRAKSSGREGLSPVRLGARFHCMAAAAGLFNGDAWREWEGFGATGEDGRGLHVKWKYGMPLTWKQRYMDVQRWRLGIETPMFYKPGEAPGPHEHRFVDDRGIWSGGGARLLWKMPGSRMFVGGSETKTKEWLKDRDLYMPGRPHGVDAMMHLMAFARKAGMGIHGGMDKIWIPNRKVGNRILTVSS